MGKNIIRFVYNYAVTDIWYQGPHLLCNPPRRGVSIFSKSAVEELLSLKKHQKNRLQFGAGYQDNDLTW